MIGISNNRISLLRRGSALLPVLAFVACAQMPAGPAARAAYDEANDPAEPTNRAIFTANQWVDRNAVRPVARAYQEYVPDCVRARLHDFALNLKAPGVLVNDLLQANFSRAWTTTRRFVVNTTAGGAGLFDVATDWDLPHHDADFGQTFGVWGVGSGPSVQLPLFGPSNVRDTVGKAAGFFADPLGFVPDATVATVQTSGSVAGAVDQRAGVLGVTDELEKTSADYYAATRDMYAKRRREFIEEGILGETPSAPAVSPAVETERRPDPEAAAEQQPRAEPPPAARHDE